MRRGGECFTRLYVSLAYKARYLVNKAKLEEARRSLEILRGDSLQEEQFELEWIEMVKGIEEEKKLAGSVGPLDMLRGRCFKGDAGLGAN